MKTRTEIKQITEYIRANDNFAVICHENPDGDALGSLMALTRTIRRAGKLAEPVCIDSAPYKYLSLAEIDTISSIEELSKYTNLITVDCADKDRIGSDSGQYIREDAFIINIDHHLSNTRFGDINYIDEGAASSAELVYRIIKGLKIPLDRETAEYLLVAVSTDTGHFSYRNTKPETLRFAAELLKAGADVQQMCNNVYKRRTAGMTRLIGRAIDSLELFSDGRVAVMRLSQKDFEECGADPADSEGLVDYARDIDTVEVAAIVREGLKGSKVSLRSDGDLDVSAIAQKKGGGGHKAAAGLYLRMGLDETVELIKNMLIEAL